MVAVLSRAGTSGEQLLQPQLLLILQVLHLLDAALAVLPPAVLHAGAAGGGDSEASHFAGLRHLQQHGAGHFVPAAVEGPSRVGEEQLEDSELVARGQNHDDGNGAVRHPVTDNVQIYE